MHVPIDVHGELVFPDHVIENIRRAHGGNIDAWLATLGPHLRSVLGELDARIVAGTPPLSYHLVFFAETSDGTGLAVKCTVPNEEQEPEVAGVDALSRSGIGPRLVLRRLDLGIIVMERVRPGALMPTHLPTLAEDADITREIASLAARMSESVDVRPYKDELLDVSTYTRALDQFNASSSLWPAHRDDVDQALSLRNQLLGALEGTGGFLHGDLHHYNILRDSNAVWHVIDPKGLIGPPGYDFGAFTYNPAGIHDHPDLAALTWQRLSIWSNITGIPWETVRSWGYVAAMLSACWSAENGGDGWQGAIKVAHTIRTLIPNPGD